MDLLINAEFMFIIQQKLTNHKCLFKLDKLRKFDQVLNSLLLALSQLLFYPVNYNINLQKEFIIQMCFCCEFPDPLVPPSKEVEDCRLYLKIIALGLLIFVVLDFIVIHIMQAIYSGLIIYFLYLGWTTFNYCAVLFYFIYCVMQSVSYLLAIIALIQQPPFFKGGMKTFEAILILILFLFYFSGIFISHYIYRVFKNIQYGQIDYMMGSFMPSFGGSQQTVARKEQVPTKKKQIEIGSSNKRFAAFTGEGVRLG